MIMEILLFILIGLAAGFIAGKIMKGSGFGIVVNIILGIAGAFIGGWLLKIIGVEWGGLVGQLATSVIGAVVLLWIASLFSKKV